MVTPSTRVTSPRAWVIRVWVAEERRRRRVKPSTVPRIMVSRLIQVPLVLAHRLSIGLLPVSRCCGLLNSLTFPPYPASIPLS